MYICTVYTYAIHWVSPKFFCLPQPPFLAGPGDVQPRDCAGTTSFTSRGGGVTKAWDDEMNLWYILI
jgi:hypothetical protein